MSHIHILPEEIIAKIAAGEVIERPSYAVKELLENSLDAQATHIIIELQDAGIKEIKITDNGEGMDKEDLLLSLLPHTTSKLTDLASLHSVQTLGFRGEALSSIAAISHLTIRSRKKGEVNGWLLESEYGKQLEVVPTGMPEGTQITVKNLFHTIPARKKFLRSIQSEVRQIVEIVTAYAFCFPEKRFFLSHNGRILLDVSPASFEERIKSLLGEKTTSLLFPFSFEESYLQSKGFLGKPQAATSILKSYVFINNRFVEDKLILASVKEAYRTLIEKTMYPFYILHLTIPFEMLDVNIHPRKTHIAFVDPTSLYSLLQKAVQEELGNQNLTFTSLTWKKETPITHKKTGKELKEEVFSENEDVLAELNESSPLQYNRLFIISLTNQGILLVDQHAAHERILYEKFKKRLNEKKKKQESLSLDTPIALELSTADYQLLLEAKEILGEVGYEIEEFHEKTVLITKVPDLFSDFNHEETIQEILDQVKETGVVTKDKQVESLLSYLSCKAAIKAGDALSSEQIQELLHQLEATPNNATCPHGRPTKILLSLKELHRMFKRS